VDEAVTYTPQPGDIYLTRFGGPVGWWITLLQAVVAGDPSRYSHAGVVLWGGWTMSAQWPYPTLVRLDELLEQNRGKPVAFLQAPEWADRERIVEAALSLRDRRYSLASYLWIGLSRLGIRPGWLRRRVSSDRAMICSALADRAWAMAGVHLFDDGRLLGEVTPGDLAHVGTIHHHNTGPYEEAS
jgi:hypothetical protein